MELDRRIDGLKDDYNKNAQPLQNRIKRLEGDVKEYVDAHRAELDGKSRTLVFGKVGYRASSKLMLAPAKVTEAIAALKALGRKELVKTTETLDREALKKEPPALLESIGAYTVSYTHLDVYKRQAYNRILCKRLWAKIDSIAGTTCLV